MQIGPHPREQNKRWHLVIKKSDDTRCLDVCLTNTSFRPNFKRTSANTERSYNELDEGNFKERLEQGVTNTIAAH